MEHLVQHAVTTIRERYGEPLNLDELARSAMVSKFHFLRVFSRVTGVTPGRFLSAVRLQEAKRLLLSTSLNVADVSAQVGYSSTGSFTRRFTESVGLSPTQYRKLSLAARDDTGEPATDAAAPAASVPAPAGRCAGSVTGALRTAEAALSPIYVGAFDSPILQGAPVSWSSTSAPGRFTLARVPQGTWYIHAVAQGSRGGSTADPELALLMATVGPVRVGADTAHRLDITLCPPDWTCPPVLSALPGIDPQPLAA
ncbi:AraC family transcriptional regulator [Streptomyces sp. NBC_00038]|uniref:helix-turn-helix domain-containing protein n=1 Tax=Streptomyces sp. NBC_00038 TaxID=2903615 RepID=UPI00225738B2|nr:AraC family transcriptional regulator [Streptomyces sp. NBC_00038]MCX5563713.1 AraC family transcriptional regulator [Streptomyces sp. NBC_00038]